MPAPRYSIDKVSEVLLSYLVAHTLHFTCNSFTGYSHFPHSCFLLLLTDFFQLSGCLFIYPPKLNRNAFFGQGGLNQGAEIQTPFGIGVTDFFSY